MAHHCLAKILKRKKISKRQFAKRIGMDYKNVPRLFREGYDPKLSQLSLWSQVLGVKVRALIEE